jgi:hypothetical protein
MSIAVSATVKPSRLLLSMVVLMCLVVVVGAIAVGSGGLGSISNDHRALVCAAAISIALVALFVAIRSRKTFRIDISGVGQIRLREYIELTDFAARVGRMSADEEGKVVQLLAGSTIWPHFMLLRVADTEGRISAIPVFRDCMSRDGFRALAVACRWIAEQNNRVVDRPK